MRIRTRQKFPVGTRIANPLEGRTGQIDGYDADTGLYTLAFHDGHRDECDEANAEKFVIKTQAAETSSSGSDPHTSRNDGRGDSEGTAEDPHKLLGAEIRKTATSYDNEEIVVLGFVTSYFPDVKRYRVSFSDGTFQELSVEEAKAKVQAHLVADGAKHASGGGSSSSSASKSKRKSKKRDAEGKGGKSSKKKKHKDKHRSTEGEEEEEDSNVNDESENREEEEVQLNCLKYPSRTAAYTIIRKVLCVILAQNAIKKMRTEKQIAVLNNEDIKVRHAVKEEHSGSRSLYFWRLQPLCCFCG